MSSKQVSTRGERWQPGDDAGEANAPRIHRWNIRVGNEITLEVDRVPSEELLLDTVEQLMQYGVLADYLKRHDHQEGLVKFMRKALRAIWIQMKLLKDLLSGCVT